MNEDRRIFLDRIVATLSEHPDWTQDALEAVMAGMQGAIEAANERTGRYDWALRAALMLAKGGRIGEDLRAILNARIVAGIVPEHCSPIEKAALERARKALEVQ